jgi:NADH dehydrogenase/NADH:ubiquinone oxidoreductase subunit G
MREWSLSHSPVLQPQRLCGSTGQLAPYAPHTHCQAKLTRVAVEPQVNEEWISDKARFQYDGLKRQRLDVPYVKTANGLAPATWQQALEAVAVKVSEAKGNEIKAVAGKLADAESMVAMKVRTPVASFLLCVWIR